MTSTPAIGSRVAATRANATYGAGFVTAIITTHHGRVLPAAIVQVTFDGGRVGRFAPSQLVAR